MWKNHIRSKKHTTFVPIANHGVFYVRNIDIHLPTNDHQVPILRTYLPTYIVMVTGNQHTPVHHPVDAYYYSVMDEPQLS
jgi:hypothetical protein